MSDLGVNPVALIYGFGLPEPVAAQNCLLRQLQAAVYYCLRCQWRAAVHYCLRCQWRVAVQQFLLALCQGQFSVSLQAHSFLNAISLVYKAGINCVLKQPVNVCNYVRISHLIGLSLHDTCTYLRYALRTAENAHPHHQTNTA